MQTITSDSAPPAIGPYSQAVKAGDFVYCSGSLPLNPESMKIEATEITGQTEQVLANMAAVLSAAGLELSNVVKTTVFLKSMADFQAMNGVYAAKFGDHKPARSTIQVAQNPLDALVEIECVAYAGTGS